MARPRKKKSCKRCGLQLPLNRKGYCRDCAQYRFHASVIQLRAKHGPFYDKWREGMLRAVEDRKALSEKLSQSWQEGMVKALQEKQE